MYLLVLCLGQDIKERRVKVYNSPAGVTRFYTEYIAATRVLQVKSALQEIAVSAEFKEWADKQSYKAEAIRVKKLILNEDLWTDIELMVDLFKPIVDLLRLVDSDLPTMGKVSIALGFANSAVYDFVKGSCYACSLRAAIRIAGVLLLLIDGCAHGSSVISTLHSVCEH